MIFKGVIKLYLSEHFDSTEFNCKCGCGKGENINKTLVFRLEEMFKYMDAKVIIVNSGYRCPTYSKKVGGSATDAHTKFLAADIKVKKQDGTWYTPADIAEVAERLGFGGIGVMNTACHVDCRDLGTYVNNHWFGNEITGAKVQTFQRGTIFPGEIKNEASEISAISETKGHLIQLFIDGIEVYHKED